MLLEKKKVSETELKKKQGNFCQSTYVFYSSTFLRLTFATSFNELNDRKQQKVAKKKKLSETEEETS